MENDFSSSSIIAAADTANMQAGADESLLERASTFTGAAILSGIYSIYNTAAGAANYLGADIEKADVAKTLSENDANQGEYYQRNKEAIDATGFMLTSLIPGGLALKGLQLAKAGTLIGPYGRALGYFSDRRTAALTAALDELGTSGGTIFNQISRNKLAAMGWETADNVLQVAAFETAVSATMKQSPLLEKDDLADIGWNIAKTAAIFGPIGGAISSLAIHNVYKNASRLIEPEMRKYDLLHVLNGVNDIPDGSKAFLLLKSALERPGEGFNIPFQHPYLTEGKTYELPTSAAMLRARDTGTKHAWTELDNLTKLMAGGDEEVAGAFSHYIYRTVGEMQQAGRDIPAITGFLEDNLLNVSKISRISDKADKGMGDLFYLAKEIPKETYSQIKTVDDFINAIRSRAPFEKNAGSQPYEILGNFDDVKIASIGDTSDAVSRFPRYATPADAYADGIDVVVMRGGTLRINPKSERIVDHSDPLLRPRQYFNMPSRSFSYTAQPTIADMGTVAVVGAKDTVIAGTQPARVMKMFDDFELRKMTTVDASARYAWLAHKTGDNYTLAALPHRISATDFPMLERIMQEGAEKWKDIELVSIDGSSRKVGDIANFGEFLTSQKLGTLKNHFAEGPEDLLSLGVKLNVDSSWVQKAIEHNFVFTDDLIAGATVPLHRSLYPANVEVRWDFSKTVKAAKGLVQDQPTLVGTSGRTLPAAGKADFVQALPDGAGNAIYGELGTTYAIKIGKQQAEDAAVSVLGKWYHLLPDLAEDATKGADSRGAGPTLAGASNADYGDSLRSTFQFAGNITNQAIKEAANLQLARFQPIMIRIADDKEAAAELGILTTRLRRSSEKFVIDPNDSTRLVNKKTLMVNEDGTTSVSTAKIDELKKAGVDTVYQMKNSNTVDFINTYREANAQWVEKRKVLLSARGWNINWDANVIHVPPVDTGRYPFFAFVRKREGFLGASSEVSMITARTDAELRKLTDGVPRGEYDVLFKENTKAYHKAKSTYDYQLSMKEPAVNSDLQKAGVLGDFFPETASDVVLEDYLRHIQQQESRVVRLGVETKYAQQFAELRNLGRQFEEISTSKMQADVKKFKSQIENPFEEYTKLALDISKRSEYTLLHDANEFAESLGRTAYRMFELNKDKALSRMVSWEEANKISEGFGIKGPYNANNIEQYIAANSPAERSLTKEFVGKANTMMVNFALRLDMVQSLINTISTPILLSTEMSSIRTLVANDSALAGKLAELRSVQIPGMDAAVPSTLKLLGRAIQNFFGDNKEQLLSRYKDIRVINETMSKYHEMIDAFSLKPWQGVNKYKEMGDKGIEIGAKFTGNAWSEEFTRFVSANVMHQLTDPIVEAGKMSLKEQNAYISIFVNRVQGNYLASQRPIAFQGVLGSAVSLFQTYQFNLLQQLFRHVATGDNKTVFTMMGMQGALYGANGIPFFEAVNNYLIGQSSLNPTHKDLYSTTALASKAVTGSTSMGEWLMYGTASAFPFWSSNAPALYTRGDINPRHISVLPISPADWVGVDGSIRMVSNLIDFGKKAVQGADMSTSLLEALEHNGINRPLAGMAQVVAGRSTTSKGSLISANNDFLSLATLSRIAGAKPMDESLALNTYFRINGYQAADQQRLEALGETVKTKLKNNKMPTSEEMQAFQLEYVKSGGRIENYSAALQRWSKDANVSIVNKLMQEHQTSYSKNMLSNMGGRQLPDYRNTGTAQPVIPAATDENEDVDQTEQYRRSSNRYGGVRG